MASWEAAKSFFSFFFSTLYRNGRKTAGKKEEKSGNMKKKKCAYPALIWSHGRWTGNKIIFKGGLVPWGYCGKPPPHAESELLEIDSRSTRDTMLETLTGVGNGFDVLVSCRTSCNLFFHSLFCYKIKIKRILLR